ncbi:2Fe-2S iron-sulfur cluster-binding protein [Cupriavidus basilensis]|uniref:2Fe-2S iron-sulfur cluster-binding protein n=1 Tax=Cupriavidus basilensis TaxID=68895 RepID=A0ABT6B2U8_9BURK|nr:2Fe-2S iron-sulfur cluster-binding protein [Cupriavidus basilensis]MDF3838271.1 2Fe-2S iron-sulfur cluster-binding protein [Cupriavidus basilensis]
MTVVLDARALRVPAGMTVAAALACSDWPFARRSCGNHPRAPFCGMGVCQECRMTIDGQRRLACQTVCREGMVLERTP